MKIDKFIGLCMFGMGKEMFISATEKSEAVKKLEKEKNKPPVPYSIKKMERKLAVAKKKFGM